MSTRKSVPKKSVVEEEFDESEAESEIEEEEEEVDPIDQPTKDDLDDDEPDEENEEEEDISIVPTRNVHQFLQKESSEIEIVSADMRITSEYMTIFEYSKVKGTRATHISKGAPLYIDPSGISNAFEIADKEIDMKLCPLSIIRKIRNKRIEIWEVNEMTKPLL